MSVIEEAGGRLDYDFIRYVVTRHDPNDVPETQIVALLRNLFGEDVLGATVWKSTAVANAGLMATRFQPLKAIHFTPIK